MDANELKTKAKSLEDRLATVEAEYKKLEGEKESLLAAGRAPTYHHTSGSYDSDEQKCMRYFSVPHVKDLLRLNTAHPRYKRVPDEYKHMVLDLKRDIDISRMTQQIVYGEQLDRGEVVEGDNPRFAAVKGVLDGNYYGRQVLAPKLKAFGSTVASAGDEWVPTAISSQFIEEFELDRNVAQQFKQVRMTTNPFTIPVQDNVTIARKQAESAAAGGIAGTNFGTSDITLSATKLVEFMPLPDELNEDSAPEILGLVRSEVVEAQGRAVEIAMLDGDTAGAHQDADVTAAEDARKSWDGLRKLALANSATIDFAAGALTVDKLRQMRELMGKFGVSVRDMAWICSSKGYNQFLDLDEVTTVEKFGQMATILKGALAALDGIPIVISEFVRDDLDLNGVHTAVPAADITTVVHLVKASRFFWGIRRPIRTRAVMDPTPPADRWLVASWWRGDFKGHTQSATEKTSILGINVA